MTKLIFILLHLSFFTYDYKYKAISKIPHYFILLFQLHTPVLWSLSYTERGYHNTPRVKVITTTLVVP